ncbi:uncharacterized protein TEOVI_000302200 [Trypanosoma equiperdum]|uniref:Uncharacterized protein n=2 Tax=Trypanozoon TaxID=39700 RepID=Q384M7_TRYB2|nr:hypothetical protein, conserved [Trypanosoma brucei brucei TREU927]EAN79754.1 hypothetical protein, conserved [Trypanosoma brucei brucei TREU927]SCU71441.1 hypothetical protein, conserved [Trypanosoma equiperdum]
MIRQCVKTIPRWQPAFVHTQRHWKVDAKRPYKRRSSNPQTVREKGNFHRDMRFSKLRPLPTVPWLQDRRRTYMDDAERLYGRKENWQNIKDRAMREKLSSLLQDYLKDTTGAAMLETRNARKYMRLCEQMDAEYRSFVAAAAFSSPKHLRTHIMTALKESDKGSKKSRWCQETVCSERAATLHEEDRHTGECGERCGVNVASQEDAAQKRRLQGEWANLENTPAMMDLTHKEERTSSYSAFPFLRQRALENKETLDPSLVDWTAKYFPDDDDRTFTTPPKLRGDTGEGDSEEVPSPEILNVRKSVGGSDSLFPKPNVYRRLRRSLRVHEDVNRSTFDAEGAFYCVRRQGSEEDRAPKPCPVRGSGAHGDRNNEVIKVAWDTVARAKEMGYSADVLRAKERLIRLTRGEHPDTIP